ncbi:MAG: polysaccharide deacetylase family protein [Pseudomonadota bacterium]
MNRLKTRVFKAGLNLMLATGAHAALSRVTQGQGIIFTMHHVVEADDRRFSPNRLLTVTPEFLEAVVTRIRYAGLDIVSLDEARERLLTGDDRRFAVLTFDDGYQDNYTAAYPILKRMNAPFCVYVTTGLPDGTACLWWLALEEIVRRSSNVDVQLGDEHFVAACASDEEKNAAYEKIYWWLRSVGEFAQRGFIKMAADKTGIDLVALCQSLSMTWDEVRALHADPLVTIGAHTVEHYAVGKVSEGQARSEMVDGRNRLAEQLGDIPRHFSYPYGDAGSAAARDFELAEELGFATAVTTRPGVLFGEHAEHLHALPRVSLNGEYQDLKYLDLYLTGAPFGLFNRFRRLNVA